MRLPNQSHLLRVAEFRYIQSTREAVEFRNPDTLSKEMLSWSQRWACDLYSTLGLRDLRARPFYYFLVARTRYYDDVLVRTVNDGARYVLIIGCGGDTRPYRFAHFLRDKAVAVLECDQPKAIRAKERIVKRLWPAGHVNFLDIDLNVPNWQTLGAWLADRRAERGLVLLEGVSPYVDSRSFSAFLEFLSANVALGTKVAYDYKLAGVDDQWGRKGGSQTPAFRLSSSQSAVKEFHEDIGFHVDFFELSHVLTRRLLPTLGSHAPDFEDDGLLQISPL